MHLPRFAIPVSGMLALICASAALALSAESTSRDSNEFVCASGERLRLDVTDAHARLRTDAGVFMLQSDADGRFHGADLSLVLEDGVLRLARMGTNAPSLCAQLRQRA